MRGKLRDTPIPETQTLEDNASSRVSYSIGQIGVSDTIARDRDCANKFLSFRLERQMVKFSLAALFVNEIS